MGRGGTAIGHPAPKYIMRYIEIIESANDNAPVRPMDRRETANLALDIAAKKLADETGLNLIQARRKLQQDEHMKRNATKMRRKFWQDKADPE